MKTTRILTALPIFLLTAALFPATTIAADTKPATPIVLNAERAALVTLTATVKAVNLKKRELTVKGPLGNEVTLVVDERVKRLGEVSVGDRINLDYYVSLSGDLRPATDAEKKTPLEIVEGLAKAPKGVEPAAGGLRVIKAVTTVEGIDLSSRILTLKGPLGNYAEVSVRDLAALKKLHIGDTILVTYTEALVVSLEKAPAKKH